MRIQRFIGLAVCMGSFAAGASAQNIHFVFPINGQQAVPQTPSPGLGTGIVSLIPASNEIVWDISWSGLSGPVTAMHFHGPARGCRCHRQPAVEHRYDQWSDEPLDR